jgi:4-hydroxy-4-methyl-2-oxoglutarate aldolase
VGLDSAAVETLQRLGTSTLYEAQGKHGALPHELKAAPGTRFLAGRAFTVRTRPGDNLALHHAVVQATPGDVLVVDCGGFLEAGVWGEILTVAAQNRGIAGIVIDGSIRDIERIAELGFPAFSRGVCMQGTGKSDPGTLGETLHWDGAEIDQGDIVVGDADGVVVIKAFEFETVMQAALQREASEAQMLAKLREGATTIDLMGLKRPRVA